MAKYSWKKLPEIREDKRHLALNAAELLANMRDNHHMETQRNAQRQCLAVHAGAMLVSSLRGFLL